MRRRFFLFTILFFAAAIAVCAQAKPVVMVSQFTLANGVTWPYDMKMLQVQTVAELKVREWKRFEVVGEAPSNGSVAYTLQGEILEWQPGDMATRIMVGMGAGREMAKIHYWLTNASGKRVFEHADTIRTFYFDNTYERSVGHLAQPFAVKIAKRLSENKSL